MAKSKKVKTVMVYMDKTDWDYEVGSASDGNKIYPDLESLKEFNRCWEGCGVVKCKISFEEIAIEEDRKRMYQSSSREYTEEEFETNREIIRVESAVKLLEYWEKLVEKQKHKVVGLKAALKKGN